MFFFKIKFLWLKQITLQLFFWFFFFLFIFIINFFFEEEPLFDLTDFSVISVICILVCLLIVFFDNFFKSSFGFFLENDKYIYFSYLSYFLIIENYIFLFLLLFFFYSFITCETDLFDSLSVLSYLWNSLGLTTIYSILICIFLKILFYFILFVFNWNSTKIIFYFFIFIINFFLFYFFCFILNILFFNISQIKFFNFFLNNLDFFKEQKLNLPNYDTYANTIDLDWRAINNDIFAIKFEDLIYFLFNLVFFIYFFQFFLNFFFLCFDFFTSLFFNKSQSYLYFIFIKNLVDNFLVFLFIFMCFLIFFNLRIIFSISIIF